MSIIIFQHTALENSGHLGEALRDGGHRLQTIEIYNNQAVANNLDDDITGVISLGGPMNVDQRDQLPWMQQEMDFILQAHHKRLPIVGICLGAQLIAAALGGEVGAMETPEIGWFDVQLGFPGTIDSVLTGLPWNSLQFHLHGQQVTNLPPDSTPLASSKMCKNQAFRIGNTTYGFQYHFEWGEKSLHQVLDAQDTQWLASAGADIPDIKEQISKNSKLYEDLGDRLSKNIATSLFPVCKTTYARPNEPVKNYTPNIS